MGCNFWMVRAGKGAQFVDTFVDEGIVAINFGITTAFDHSATKDDLTARLRSADPTRSDQAIATAASQAIRFAAEIQPGDVVITYAPTLRIYYLGEVTSAVAFRPKEFPRFPHVRQVSWKEGVLRDALTVETRNSLGAIQTLFALNASVVDDLRANAKPIDQLSSVGSSPTAPKSQPSTDVEESGPEDLLDEMVQKANDFLADRINRLDWEEMQELVAGLLRAMGYRTKVSPPGADRGCDVFASPDGLGLQDPRIFVEVKHRQAAIGAPDIRSFIGGRQSSDRCLYVSTGGFTKDAKYEADRSSTPLRLLTLPDLAELVADRYSQLDDETRALVPLRRIYWPAD